MEKAESSRRSFIGGTAAFAATSMMPNLVNAAKLNSKFNGVKIGVNSGCFEKMSDGSAERMLKYITQCGISSVELKSKPAEEYARTHAGANPMDIKRGIDKAVEVAVDAVFTDVDFRSDEPLREGGFPIENLFPGLLPDEFLCFAGPEGGGLVDGLLIEALVLRHAGDAGRLGEFLGRLEDTVLDEVALDVLAHVVGLGKCCGIPNKEGLGQAILHFLGIEH